MDVSIQSMLKYIDNYVEKPSIVSNGMPLCPFARKSRISERLYFDVFEFSLQDQKEIQQRISLFNEEDFDVYILLHPKVNGISVADLYVLCDEMGKLLPTFQVFTGHPEDDFRVKNTLTRQDPYPNLQFIPKTLLEKSRAILRKTKYYSELPKEKPDDPIG